MDMFGLVVFVAPPVLGAALWALGTSWPRVYALFGLGVVLGLFVILAAYLTAPPDFQHSNGTEGEEYLGRWLDPAFVVTFVALGYFLWFVGVVVGAFVRFLVAPRSHRSARVQ
jgi:hypothetical protein